MNHVTSPSPSMRWEISTAEQMSRIPLCRYLPGYLGTGSQLTGLILSSMQGHQIDMRHHAMDEPVG